MGCKIMVKTMFIDSETSILGIDCYITCCPKSKQK